MAPTAVISGSELDKTFGYLFLASIFTSILWGVGCLQLWIYFERYFKTDKHWFKLYMLLAFAFDTVHQVIIVQTDYMYFVRGIADPTILARSSKFFTSIAIISAITNAMVQGVFVRRAWFVSDRNMILTGALSLLIAGLFATEITYFVQTYSTRVLADLAKFIHTDIAINAMVASTDMSIAVVLIFYLWRGRTGFKGTSTIINRLVAYTIGTGLITGVFAIAALVVAIVEPSSFFYVFVDLLIPKLYFNCVLASLNARTSLRETIANDTGLSIRLATMPTSVGASSGSYGTYSGTYEKTTGARAIECNVGIAKESRTDSNEKLDSRVRDVDIESSNSMAV